MASKPLDSLTCTTAADAFTRPLPQVRQFHRSLTSELDEKNARLRTLVGGSYRQLLGTAETILQMREDVGAVEDCLGRVGAGCGRAAVGRLAKGLGSLQGALGEGPAADHMRWIARVKCLEMCALAVGRLLRRSKVGGGSHLVTAAKVLVLSRLLAKELGDSRGGSNDEEPMEETKRKLAGLKKRLLRAIERTWRKSNGDDGRQDLLQALCAYSLAASLGAKDVVRHFLYVRGEALSLAFEEERKSESEEPRILRALGLYTRTLLDVQALVPRRLAEGLAALKTKPLLNDEAVRGLEILRLDVCDRWFGDQILFFIPYVRHDDLAGQQAVEMLNGWAKKASEVLLEGFSKIIQRVGDFKTLVELRTACLEVWIKDGGKVTGFDPSFIFNGLRTVINDHMVQLLNARVGKLHLVGTEIEGTLETWRRGITDRNPELWDKHLLESQITDGATSFKKEILARTHGRNDAVSRVVEGYKTWRHLVDEIFTVLDQLRRQRWDDDIEDIADDVSIESRNTLLSSDDPQMLQDHLNTSLEKAHTDLDEKISILSERYKDSEDFGHIAIYALRIIRDIRAELPTNASLPPFGVSLVPVLHQRLASTASADAVERLAKTFYRNSVPGRILWEGNPELPVQPSPGIFKFLHTLTTTMASMGNDLWSPAAVRVLKKNLRVEIGSRLNAALKVRDVQKEENSEDVNGTKTNGLSANGGSEAETSNGDKLAYVEDGDPTKRKEVLIQLLFDVSLLHQVLETNDELGVDLNTVRDIMQSQTDLDPSSRNRLQQGAQEFWKRTNLLFGLLAST